MSISPRELRELKNITKLYMKTSGFDRIKIKNEMLQSVNSIANATNYNTGLLLFREEDINKDDEIDFSRKLIEWKYDKYKMNTMKSVFMKYGYY